MMRLLFDVAINSALSFLTMWLLLAFTFWLIRPSPRMRSICRFAILVKLALDPLFYDWSSWVVNHGLLATDAPAGSRSLLCSLSFGESPIPIVATVQCLFKLHSSFSFSVADLLAENLPGVQIFGVLFGLGAAFKILTQMLALGREAKHLGQVMLNAEPFHQSMTRYRVLLSRDVSVPIAYARSIVLPKELVLKLTALQMRAVIQHEAAHLRWLDPWQSVTASLIHSGFWFIPGLTTFVKKMELEKELACDAVADPMEMAEAIQKAVLHVKFQQGYQIAMALCRRDEVVRVEILTRHCKRLRPLSRAVQGAFLTYLTTMIFFGQFWRL